MRRADRDNYTALPAVEEASDQLFATFGVQIPASVSALEDYADPAVDPSPAPLRSASPG